MWNKVAIYLVWTYKISFNEYDSTRLVEIFNISLFLRLVEIFNISLFFYFNFNI